MSADYFIERQRRAAESLLTACAVEAAVANDIRRVIEFIDYIPEFVTVDALHWLDKLISADAAASDYYTRTRSSTMLVELARLFEGMDVPVMLRELAMQPTPFDGVDGNTGEVVINLANGYELRSGWIDKDDPDMLPAGDYVSVVNVRGEQVFYGDSADLFCDPVRSRRSLFEILQACCGARVTSDPGKPHQTGLTPPP